MAGDRNQTSPYRLVTVNTAPERARQLIGRLIEALKDQHTIIHAANVEKIKDVGAAVREHEPDLLFCASMWTPEEAAEIQAVARRVRPGIVTYAIPRGLQVEQGPDAVVEHLICVVPQVLKAHYGSGLSLSKPVEQ